MTATLPRPGLYGTVEIRHSKRGHWYAMRHHPDGTSEYLAQDIDLDEITSPTNEDHCLTPGCRLPVLRRNLCGMCLAKDTVARLRSIK